MNNIFEKIPVSPKENELPLQELLKEIEIHDKPTFEHSKEVGMMAEFIAEELVGKFNPREKQILERAAWLHDYGKTGIETEIINNRSRLSEEEVKKIKMHPKIGFEVLRKWDKDVAEVVVAHHEFQENSYPRSMKSSLEEDNEERRRESDMNRRLAKILAMIDSFQAMLAERPGESNGSKTVDQAISELQKRFALPEDQEIIFLLESYYRKKHPRRGVEYEKYIHLTGKA